MVAVCLPSASHVKLVRFPLASMIASRWPTASYTCVVANAFAFTLATVLPSASYAIVDTFPRESVVDTLAARSVV